MLDSIFLQISILLALTVIVAFVMRLLRQPLLVGYLVAGIIAGPLFLNLLDGNTELFDALAHFGVILLLFVVGLSLNFDHLKKIGKISVVTALAQVFFTAGIGFFILYGMLGATLSSALYLAIGMTFSSTIIIVKLLADKKDAESVYGRYTIGLMVVQDVIALCIMIIITSLAEGGSLLLTANQFVIRILLLIGFVFFLARYIVPKLLSKVAMSGEFLFLFTVAWCFSIASLLYWLGFSAEVGALIAGVTLGSSPYQAEISSRIRSLRDFFIVLFFVILGSQFRVGHISDILLPGIILSFFILLGNPFILYHTFRRFQFTRRNSFLAGVTAAQVSEFGFVLLYTGQQLGHIQGVELEIFTLVALITIFLSTYGITYNETIYRRLLPFFELFGRDKYRQKEPTKQEYDVWVFGYHRIGWKVCEVLAEKGISFAVVDFNPKAVQKLHARGIPAFFGDAADVEFLSTLPLEKAKMVMSTIPAADDQLTLIKHVRRQSEKSIIIANLYHTDYLENIYDAGADYVMLPHLLGGHFMATILREKPWTRRTFGKLKEEQNEEMRLRFTVKM